MKLDQRTSDGTDDYDEEAGREARTLFDTCNGGTIPQSGERLSQAAEPEPESEPVNAVEAKNEIYIVGWTAAQCTDVVCRAKSNQTQAQTDKVTTMTAMNERWPNTVY
ncbi:uncharacterized protein MEPE_02247 [Melanopsichium pennsylvanicum]|uniref:Uncharacterized protein n=1 Tax=Melanopsichium pennsylvanicum TaxID=63383 RepID=A0AAJ4XJ83_9BASI|nr:uncharacterized protein MEPE_02247 [Melanopsichium pennsylvanicum]